MDPNECAFRINHATDLDARIDAADALRDWLNRGGFAPDETADPGRQLQTARQCHAVLLGLLAQYRTEHGEAHPEAPQLRRFPR